MDIIFTFINSMEESDKEKQKVRNATQADFDRLWEVSCWQRVK